MWFKKHGLLLTVAVVALVTVVIFRFSNLIAIEYHSAEADVAEKFIPLPTLDKADYDARLLALAHANASTTAVFLGNIPAASSSPFLWPVKQVYPDARAILPFKRIVAYYGNFLSAQMGILGEYPPEVVLAKLASTSALWSAADPTTPILPAIQYIAVVAQGSKGREGKYILRMPDREIDKALGLANQISGILILDVQVGSSTLQNELPLLAKYLAMPQVHLAIDPEFSMKYGKPPGTAIGTFDAADINYAAEYLASLVTEYHLPPKVLIVHRFTYNMVTDYKQIKPLPQVEIVVDMDGFGSKAEKYNTYSQVIVPEPVQFTGIKLFYKNDVRSPADNLLSPTEVLSLTPAPIYIQYQ